jgi:DNA-binding NarL/FixJ family response regulator
MKKPALSDIRVLVVDDDQLFRNGMRRLLHSMERVAFGNIQEAPDGQSAMRLLDEQPIDLVLIDYQMPGGTGLDWLERITGRYSDVAVIMVTGQGDETVAVEAMHHGAMDYLVKGGISPEHMERAIINALEKRNMKRTLEQQRQSLIEAERSRVMLESLGAACHHLGQPATVILSYLELMQNEETEPEKLEIIEECIKAARKLGDILHRFQSASEYRTVPYINVSGTTVRILDINEEGKTNHDE